MTREEFENLKILLYSGKFQITFYWRDINVYEDSIVCFDHEGSGEMISEKISYKEINIEDLEFFFRQEVSFSTAITLCSMQKDTDPLEFIEKENKEDNE